MIIRISYFGDDNNKEELDKINEIVKSSDVKNMFLIVLVIYL